MRQLRCFWQRLYKGYGRDYKAERYTPGLSLVKALDRSCKAFPSGTIVGEKSNRRCSMQGRRHMYDWDGSVTSSLSWETVKHFCDRKLQSCRHVSIRRLRELEELLS